MIEARTHVRACLYCREPVAINARRCPHCGARGPTNRAAFTFNTRWPLIVSLIFGLGALGLFAWYRLAA